MWYSPDASVWADREKPVPALVARHGDARQGEALLVGDIALHAAGCSLRERGDGHEHGEKCGR